MRKRAASLASPCRFGDGINLALDRDGDMAIVRRKVLAAELESLDQGLLDTDAEDASHVTDAPAVFLLPGPTPSSAASWAPPVPTAFILLMLLVGASLAALVFHSRVSQFW